MQYDIEPYPDDDPEPYPDDSIEDEIESYSDDNQETCDTQAIKFHEIRKRLSSCPDNCTWRLSRQEFQEISKNRPKSQMDHAQWLLDYFFEHATEENVCHLICGKEVCEKCWREVHKVSPYKYNKYLGESRQGVRGKIHGNTGSIKPSIEHTESIGWFQNFVSDIGEHMPHQEKVTLPAGMKKTDVWKLMTSDLDSQSLAKSSFMKIWKNSFSNITIVKENPFSKCHICTTLHFEYEQCGRYDKEGKKLIIDKKREHWEYVRKQKEAYYMRREASCLYPKRFLTIIIDGMDQKKTNIPILYTKARNSKQISNLQQVRTHLLGVLVHRDLETSGMRKVGFGHFDLMQYPHDANLNLTVLLETLCEFKDALGTELHLQTDSASDNKNKTVLGFLGLLVHLGIFEECYLHMLPVGHTHEDIDSMFSNFSSSLKGDIMTLDDLLQAFQKLSYVERGKIVKLVWDFKGWMENSLINSHGLGDQFEFRIHTVDKERRIPIFHYRKGEGERWMPDAADDTTYEVHQDRCGILIFKDMDFLQRAPECVAPTDKSMYLDRILKETCPKLLKSGLLTSTEQQWWENFSSEVMTYLKTSRNVDFPLIHLIESVKEIPETLMSHPVETRLQELEDKAMKRALVYTGNYLPPKKRKAAEKSKKQRK